MWGGALASALFVTWNGGGNVTPVVVLAQHLVEAGCAVTVLGEPAQSDRIEATGATFLARDPARQWDPVATAEDALDACTRAAPDLAVVDYMLPTALCGTEAAGVGTAALVHTLYGALLVDGAPGPIFMAADVDAVNRARTSLGLPEVATMGEVLDRAACVLVPCPSELDTVGDPLADNVRYVAPILASGDCTWDPPEGSDPLVLVSLGTTPMDEAPVLTRVLDGVADLAVRVVATVGDHLDPAAIDVPDNCTLTHFVPHPDVMTHAAAVITHAGLGTVLASLAHGVPMVCLPLGREQPDNAAAVARVGAGIVLPAEAPPPEIAAALRTVLDEPHYVDRAVELGASMLVGPDPLDALAAAATGA